MRSLRFGQVILAVGGAVAATLVVVALAATKQPTFDERETRRVRAHFDSVLAELPQRDVGDLSPEKRARRAQLFRTLAAYRDRGLFPHNYDVPGRQVPTFVDPRTGIRCAVGELLASTGHDDITQRVARTNIHVYAAELGVDREFSAWLDDNGLTLAEASRIQPSYGGNVRIVKPVNESWQNTDIGLAWVSGVLATWNITANRDGHIVPLNTAGLLTGFATAAIGGITDGDRVVTHQAANMAMIGGGLSMTVSAIETWRHLHQKTPSEKRVSVAPLFRPDGRSTVGLAARIRF